MQGQSLLWSALWAVCLLCYICEDFYEGRFRFKENDFCITTKPAEKWLGTFPQRMMAAPCREPVWRQLLAPCWAMAGLCLAFTAPAITNCKEGNQVKVGFDETVVQIWFFPTANSCLMQLEADSLRREEFIIIILVWEQFTDCSLTTRVNYLMKGLPHTAWLHICGQQQSAEWNPFLKGLWSF